MPTDLPTNRIDDLVDRLDDSEIQQVFETELDRFNPAELNSEEREAWHSWRGILAFQRGDRAEALARFEEGFRICPDSGLIAFSLGQELQETGEAARMFEARARDYFFR